MEYSGLMRGAAELIIGAADFRMTGAITDARLQTMIDEAFNDAPN